MACQQTYERRTSTECRNECGLTLLIFQLCVSCYYNIVICASKVVKIITKYFSNIKGIFYRNSVKTSAYWLCVSDFSSYLQQLTPSKTSLRSIADKEILYPPSLTQIIVFSVIKRIF